MSIPPDRPDYDDEREREYRREEYGGREQANPTSVPSIGLIIVAVINMLLAVYLVINGIVARANPEFFQSYVEQIQKMSQERGQPVPEIFQDTKTFANSAAIAYFVWAPISFIAALITLIGAIRMRGFHSYGLALTGAVLASIPCISCFCFVGQVIGIWALVVLLKPEVKALFR